MIRIFASTLDCMTQQGHLLATTRAWLPQRELEWIDACKVVTEQQRRLTIRALLKAACLHLEEETWQFKRLDSGQPVLLGPGAPFLSMSHSGNFIMIGISPEPIGIDFENSPDLNLEIIGHLTNPQEQTRLSTLSDEIAIKQACLQYWTAKEACTKMLGKGFSLDPRLIHFDPQSSLAHLPAQEHPSPISCRFIGWPDTGFCIASPLPLPFKIELFEANPHHTGWQEVNTKTFTSWIAQ
jgi:phosphopantetheinyl transferase